MIEFLSSCPVSRFDPIIRLDRGAGGYVINTRGFSMNARARFWVSGRVQGVFFRDNTRRWASSFGLSGWVRNLPDGRVEALVEGDKEKITSLERRLWEGPPLSHVLNVQTEWETYTGEFSDFRII
jgi:acylphosphatase